MFAIDFEPVGRRGNCPENQSIFECARRLNVDIVSICGGAGSCHRCKVQVVSGSVSALTVEEKSALSERELNQNYRLACLTYPRGKVKIHIPPESLSAPQRVQVEGLELDVKPGRILRLYPKGLTPAALSLILRGDVLVLLSITVTLTADGIAMLRYLPDRAGTSTGWRLAALAVGLCFIPAVFGHIQNVGGIS